MDTWDRDSYFNGNIYLPVVNLLHLEWLRNLDDFNLVFVYFVWNINDSVQYFGNDLVFDHWDRSGNVNDLLDLFCVPDIIWSLAVVDSNLWNVFDVRLQQCLLYIDGELSNMRLPQNKFLLNDDWNFAVDILWYIDLFHNSLSDW
eukprot:CAMPEP_0203746850 /NCGR_PEP_ID=MMETSP0098-20131031/2174_1 /ASSEMBLY_ACC=CAM_ASM_000208 /TAXON_ID=96639 /ORGANISM=" , Strain NY0313808BC1" /LENGTH=144 /DNA_ID=CAMNT_0050635101 /DNA_START=257 /DNA_END=688 /DNA_ORIENTATION=-